MFRHARIFFQEELSCPSKPPSSTCPAENGVWKTRQGAWPINRNWNGFNTWPEYDHKPTKEEVDVFARELFKAMFGVEPIFIGMEDDEYEYDSRAGL